MANVENPQFNSQLEDARKTKKISQRALSLKTGLDHSTISRLEAGNRKPMLDTAIVILQALGEELSMPTDKPFSQWLGEQRKSQNLSMRKLGKISGVNHSTISRIERGRALPTLEIAQKISDAFK